MLTPDTIIGQRYRILRPIGKGGMGAVYEVTDERLGCTRALKQMTVTGEKFAQAFEQEARLLARLSHLSLPQVHDHFSDPLGQFLVMEYIPGPDLREALTARQSPFAVEEVLRLADQLLDVLEYLHTQPEPVIHRDIKPANIKVLNGQVKLLDFGLTKGSADYVSRIRMSSLTGYTLTFAPPEQIRGKPTGPRSDLFSLAATLHCLLTGVDPPDALERVFAIQEGNPDLLQPATTLNAQVPQAVNDILLQAMALSYEPRPVSAAAMRSALREAAPALWQPGGAPWSGQSVHNPASNRGAQGIFYGPVYFGQPVPDAQEAAHKQAEEEEQQPPPPRRTWAVATVVLLLAALLAGGGALMDGFLNGGGITDGTPTSPAVAEVEPTATSTPKPTPPPTATPEPIPTATTTPTNPLFPVTIEEWRGEMARRTTEMTREGDHYWRYVPGGTYTIGGWTDDDNDNNDEQAEVELQPYWIGKYPITVQQYRQFIEAGGYDKQEYWTPDGWEWKEAYNEGEGRSQPYWWNAERYSSDNQPVIGMSWYEATAFMNWLNAQLAGTLPEGYAVQLPTEAEWEAACAYDAEGQRHPYPWGEEEPTRNLADFDDGSNPDRAADVGGRTGGAAACGAQDMVGSVWEVTTSSYRGYPGASGKVVGDFEEDDLDVPWRGGSWGSERTYVRCAARLWDHPVISRYNLFNGFRPVVSPPRAN